MKHKTSEAEAMDLEFVPEGADVLFDPIETHLIETTASAGAAYSDSMDGKIGKAKVDIQRLQMAVLRMPSKPGGEEVELP